MKKSYKKVIAVVLAMILLVVSAPFSGAARTQTDPYQFIHDDEYIYWYRSPHRYAYMENGVEHYPYIPAMYNLLYGNESLAVYCCDLITSVVEGTAYKRINLEDSGYFSDDYAAHIRGIFSNGYQKGFTSSDLVSLAEKAGISNTSSLTAAEALSATQTAIWTYANNGVLSDIYYGTRTITSTSDIKDPVTVNVAEGGKSYTTEISKTANNIQKVYDYLIKQKDTVSQSVVWSLNDDVTVLTVKDGSSYDVTVKFKIDGSNDSVNVVLYADLLKGTSVVDTQTLTFNGKKYPEKDNAGYYTVTFEDVSANDLQNNSVKLSLSGTQELATDVYFYDPEGGRHNAQSFVGLGSGSSPVADELTAKFAVGTQSLSVYTYDEDAGEDAKDYPMSDIEFELYASVDGAEPELCSTPKTTGENGTVTWEGLTKDDGIKYYYKQTSSADGYEDASKELKEFGNSGSESVANSREEADFTVGNTIDGTDRHFSYTVELDLSKSDLASNEFSWLDLNEEYKSVTVEYSNACDDDTTHPDEVQFTENEDGKLVAHIELSSGEKITFKDLPVGTTYSVAETDDKDKEMQDNTLTEIENKVYSCKDGSQGGVVSSDSEANELEFKNKEYTPDSTEITGKVYLDGALSEEEFSFKITDISDETPEDIDTVENDKNGSIDFGTFDYTTPGTYKYEIKQTSTGDGYEFDDSVYTVTVEVTKDDENSKLVAGEPLITKSDSSENVEEIVFENYRVSKVVNVEVDFILDDDGTKPDSVTVELYKDGELYETKTLNEENNWEFGWKNLRNDSEWTVEAPGIDGFTKTEEDDGVTFTFTYDDIPQKEDEPTTNEEEPTTDEPTTSEEETTSKVESTTSSDESTTSAEESTTSLGETTTSKVESTTAEEEKTTSSTEATTIEEATTSVGENTTASQDRDSSEEQTTDKQSTQTATTQKTESQTNGTTSVNGQTTQAGASSETKVPETGDNATADLLAIAFIAVGFVLLCVSRKRRVTE